jgi:Fe(II)/alpha-ketoglutarate-dependent arginine beta-hydroxylase
MDSNRLHFEQSEIKSVQELVNSCLNLYDNFDDNHFLKDLPLMAYQLPQRVVKFLNEFKYNPHETGYCVLSTGLVDREGLGLTPSHWERKANNDTCQNEVMSMCLCAGVLGDIFGWLTQQDGRIIHDIVPIQKHENEQLGSGSKEELTWHTEDAFHELRGDYLMLMCLRNNDSIPTTLSKPDYSKLTQKQIDILFEKQFTIRPDNSHKPANSSKERKKVLAGDEGLKLAYDTILNRDKSPEKIAVLFGNKNDPCLRLDPYFMDVPKNSEAREALSAIIDLVGESLIEVSLNPGEILIIDNYEVVHGRRAFEARFDGSDRWYKRINVIRDIRRCNQVLETKRSRIIY